MLISSEIGSGAKIIGEEKTIEYMAKARFDAFDFSMNSMCKYDWANACLAPNDHPLASREYLSFARKLKRVGEDFGIRCNQSHAPHPVRLKEVRDSLKRAIECTAEAGGEICVIHPDNNKSAEENREMYLELLPFAKEHKIKIATENMWNWNRETQETLPAACSDCQSFLAHLNAVDDEFFVACLDIGHAEIMGESTSAVKMIKALSSKLQALHIHDNNKHNDNHLIPFSAAIDFDAVVSALKSVNYEGYLTLEAYNHLKKCDENNVFEGIKELASSAKRLADMF